MKKISMVIAAAATLFSVGMAPAMAAPWNEDGLSGWRSTSQMVRNSRGNQAYERGNYGRDRGYYNRGGRHYYNGQRGYNYYRPGYREYNGWWFPGAAFAAGALIGGAVASQPSYSGGGGHVAWCSQQYRSYRASDNTFQPYNGPRQQCVSP
ncbi:BA14K family protein [Ancylobacter sp. VKM B-3255]|uniref:Lectin-like protein BA14k n=2 Tax=Ancylobacter radicis TaxID=2836179 RepID=A0ABS5RA26_9HYPH|nr:BA14K family protein [Ancylobacter radicis]